MSEGMDSLLMGQGQMSLDSVNEEVSMNQGIRTIIYPVKDIARAKMLYTSFWA